METNNNYRGKGVSTKLTKDGKPKRAGNWSYNTIHTQSLQFRDYKVMRIDNELVVGDNQTPLSHIMGEVVATLALNNPYFHEYTEKGIKTVRGKQYEAQRSLTKFSAFGSHMYLDYEFILREQIYTDGDFDYPFPEY